MHIYIYTHAMCVCVVIYIYIYMHACMDGWLAVCLCLSLYVSVCLFVCLSVRVCVSVCVCAQSDIQYVCYCRSDGCMDGWMSVFMDVHSNIEAYRAPFWWQIGLCRSKILASSSSVCWGDYCVHIWLAHLWVHEHWLQHRRRGTSDQRICLSFPSVGNCLQTGEMFFHGHVVICCLEVHFRTSSLTVKVWKIGIPGTDCDQFTLGAESNAMVQWSSAGHAIGLGTCRSPFSLPRGHPTSERPADFGRKPKHGNM